MLSKIEISKILGYLLADSGRPIRDEKVQVWHDQFQKLDYETAWKAAKHLNAKGFYGAEPQTKDFRESIGEVTETVRITGDEAFNLALQAVQRFGSYAEQEALKSLPQKVAVALQRFGYKELCMAEASLHGVHRPQFAKIFEAVKSRDSFERAAPQIAHNPVNKLVTNLSKQLGAK